MTNFHHFLPLDRLPDQEDMDLATSLLHFPVMTSDGRQFIVSLLGQAHVVNCICVTIPDSDGRLSEEDSGQVTRLNAHMLATLRMTYDEGADVVRIGDGFLNLCQMTEEEFPTKFAFLGAMPRNPDFRVNGENIKNTFNCASQMPELIALIGETGLPALPLQYKFLAVYKVLDLASKGHRGFAPVVQAIIDKREPKFEELGLSDRKFRSFIHEYRDKCAHIYTGNEPTLGIVGLTSGDADRIRKVLPLMRDTMVEVVHTCFSDLGMSFASIPQ